MLVHLERAIDKIVSLIPQSMPDNARIQQCRIIAHRGAHSDKEQIIENTIAAFDGALKYGCDGIELDIHSTKDHVVVVHHDPDLKRLWGLNHRIDELDFKTLHKLVPEIPSLKEIISKYGQKMQLFIELKSPFSDYSQLADELKPLEPEKDFYLISLDENSLQPLTSYFDKKALLLVPDFGDTKKYCRMSIEKDYGGVMGHYLLLNNRRLRQLTNAGQKAGVGFVDSEQSLKRELNRGILWLFTNQAQRVCGIRKQLAE